MPDGSEFAVWFPQKNGDYKLGSIRLPQTPGPGLSDSQIRIKGFNIEPDHGGNFLKYHSDDELDAIHTYAIIRSSLNMLENVLGHKMKWTWNKNGNKVPLVVNIRYPDSNSYFAHRSGELQFGHYKLGNRQIYCCRSWDLVAHETGHPVFEALMPRAEIEDPESHGLLEAFCDLIAMFTKLSDRQFVSQVLQSSMGNLRESNLLSCFGLGFEDQAKDKPIRDAINQLTWNRELLSGYDYCELFTGIIYDTLIDYYEVRRDSATRVEAEVLQDCFWEMARVIIGSYQKLDPAQIRFQQIIENLLESADLGFKDILNKNLTKRSFYVA